MSNMSIMAEKVSETLIGEDDEDMLPKADEDSIHIPDTVFMKILRFLYLEDLKESRLVCKLWYSLSLTRQILPRIGCFIFDGCRDTQDGSNCADYLRESDFGFSPWILMRLRRAHFKQLSWITHKLTSKITVLELNNCSLSWTNILFVISEFDNLSSFSDIQDMYCWDYSTFAEGLDNDEDLDENVSFKALRQDRLMNLGNLRSIRIHRSQFADCTTYLKMFNLRCENLMNVSVTTDQSLNPRPSERFYQSLGDLIQKNRASLQSLWFPYRHIYPVYEFRVSDDNNPFRDFINFVTENNWATLINPELLSELSIQFPIVHIDELYFKQKLLTFLQSWTSLKKFYLNCIFLEPGKENILLESIPPQITPRFGVWISDNGQTGELPYLGDLREHFQTLTVQTWRPIWIQVKDIITLPSLRYNHELYKNTTELQYFNKSPNFRSFNFDLLIQCFSHLTHLNLVDHNTRGERLHSSEALATIEDDDMQLILTYLRQLTFLQMNGNMTFLTDSGITGLTPLACRRMLRTSFVKIDGDVFGKSFSNMTCLRHIVLRGVGIKVTDVIAYFGFQSMPKLKKLHIYGSQQVTHAARTALAEKFPTLRGCDIQI